MPMTSTMATIDGRFRLGEEIRRDETGADDRERYVRSNDNARVFHAEDLKTGATVAFKILLHPASKGADFRSRFQRDVAIMQSLDHPNLVKTIAAGTTSQGQPYFVMELLQGQTLADRLREQGPLPAEEMAVCLEQVASALDATHAKGLVHRAINPNAIMIVADSNDEPSYKLLDFGLDKEITRPSAAQVEFTSKQSSLGTAAYLSPEQARGGEVDARSDVYGLGVTLYESLTGRLPFEGETDFQILLAQINGSIPPFPVDWSDLETAEAIEAVVLTALAKDPADRPPTGGALSRSFQDALLSQPSRRFSFSWPAPAGGALLIILLGLLAKWLL